MATASLLSAADAVGAEPKLFRTTLRLEPTMRHIATMPSGPGGWRVSAGAVAQWDHVMAAARFSAPLAAQLRKALRVDAESGEGWIDPEPALRDLFRPAERVRWWAILSSHPANRTHRWPIAIKTTELDALAADPNFAEAVRRVHQWGIPAGPRVIFGDLFALDGAFSNPSIRQAFLQRFFGADTVFAKLVADDPRHVTIAASAAYWQTSDHSRELEPILSALGAITDNDRIDLAHLLPRFARSLLYTFPPDFEHVEEPSVENAAMAVGLFRPDEDPQAELRDGFSAWLRTHCDVVDGGDRHYGDIVVFEDAAVTRWPFAMVYLADGIVFGRRPTLYGPWELMSEVEVPELNPRLRGLGTTVWRRRTGGNDAGAAMAPPRWVPETWPQRPELRELAAGPWGRLWSYDVLLAPSDEVLDRLPHPDPKPKWAFYDTDPQDVVRTIATLDMPEAERNKLSALFRRARPDRQGRSGVQPSHELVLATPAAFRVKHFGRLMHGVYATDHAQDISIAARAGAAAWFSPEFLPESARSTVLKLVYPRGRGQMLSDFGTLFHELPDATVRRKTLRALFRTPALILLLERPRPEEVAGLADYWKLDQQKHLAGLLSSFAEAEALSYLDVVHLLPPLAREMMNVYIGAAADDANPSCYWTALNFAAEQPDSRLLVTPDDQSGTVAWAKLQAEYDQVTTAGELGDVVAYRRKSDGALRHVSAYVAADVVFTKNGVGPSAPWCLMHLEDVDALYAHEELIERMVFRPRTTDTKGN